MPLMQGGDDRWRAEETNMIPERAFDASFNFRTHRCTPTAPCRTCLEFCDFAPLPLNPPEAPGPAPGQQPREARYFDDSEEEDHPPVLRNLDEEEAARRRKGTARHGPVSKSSIYRGVTYHKRTGRWEAHIWHQGAQAYLGASTTKVEAARAYDKAALLLGGPGVNINFQPESYQLEMSYLYKLSKDQLVIYLRRDSRGYGAQATYPNVKHVKNQYEAVYGEKLLGTFPTEDDAARAVYQEAVRDSYEALASLIIDTHHVRNMPSYAAERFAALHPEAVKHVLRSQPRGSSASRKFSVTRRQKLRSVCQSSAAMPSSLLTPSPAESATGSAALDQHPPVKINVEVEPLHRTYDRTLGPGPAFMRPHPGRHEMEQTFTSAGPLINSLPSQLPTEAAPQHIWPTNLHPVSTRAPAPKPPATATPATATHSKPSPEPGSVKFKLFNVEISVNTEPGHDDDSNNVRAPPRGESSTGSSEKERGLNAMELPPKKKFKSRFKLMARAGISSALESPEPVTPSLKDVVSINRKLHEILDEMGVAGWSGRAIDAELDI